MVLLFLRSPLLRTRIVRVFASPAAVLVDQAHRRRGTRVVSGDATSAGRSMWGAVGHNVNSCSEKLLRA